MGFGFIQLKLGTRPERRVIRKITESIQRLAKRPERGRSCNYIREGYRKFAIGSHVIFYRMISEGISLVRILHQRMDFEQHLR